MLEQFLSPDFWSAILRAATPIVFAALGATVAAKSGITNMALEGIMLFCALFGVIFTSLTGQFLSGLLLTMVAGGLLGLLLDFFVVRLKTDEILAAIALNLFATGGTVLLLLAYSGDRGTSSSIESIPAPKLTIPLLERIPFLGEVLSGQSLMTYLAVLAVILVHLFLYKTPQGLCLRAVGENRSAAESVGISSRRLRCTALVLSGVLASMGGFFLSGGYLGMFTRDMAAGKGFIALAASSMGHDTPVGGMLVSLLFGAAQAVANLMQLTWIPRELIQMIPYLTTLAGLCVYSYTVTKPLCGEGKYSGRIKPYGKLQINKFQSAICKLDGGAESAAAALTEAENFAHRCGLGQKRLLHLRLLAEELLGMAGSVVDVKQGTFWVEREGMACRLCLNVYIQAGQAAKRQLLDVSSSGGNTFYQGAAGKIRQAVDWLSQGDTHSAHAPEGMAGGLLPSTQETEWSLTRYRESIRQESGARDGSQKSGARDGSQKSEVRDGSQKSEVWDGSQKSGARDGTEKAKMWDGLERSVLTKLADDILVGVRADQVSISILKVLC